MIFINEVTPIMSGFKLSMINPHTNTIIRMSQSSAHVTANILKRSKRMLNRDGSDDEMNNDEPEQLDIVLPEWEDGQETPAPAPKQRSSGRKGAKNTPPPEDSDSERASDEENHEEEVPETPKRGRGKQIVGPKGQVATKDAKSTGTSSGRKRGNAKTEEVSVTKSQPARGKRGKSSAQEEKPAPKPARSSRSKHVVSEEPVNLDEPQEEVPETPAKRGKTPKPSLEELPDTRHRYQEKPKLVRKPAKKSPQRRKFEDEIDEKVYDEYRNIVKDVLEDTQLSDKTVLTPEDRFEEMDEFYGVVDTIHEEMEEKYGDAYSDYNIQFKKSPTDDKTNVIAYVGTDDTEIYESKLDGETVLAFFRMPSMKKEIKEDTIIDFLCSGAMQTVNVLAFNAKQMPIPAFDRLLMYSHYNDVPFEARPDLKFHMPSYIRLMSRLNRCTFMDVFNARTNWLCLITPKDREALWANAVKAINEYECDSDAAKVFKNLLNSEYVKYHFMYCAQASILFTKLFGNFMETKRMKDDIMKLCRGPLKSIAFLFTPMEYSYRGVELDNSGEDATFDDLVKETDDPEFWDPRNSHWIGKMLP